MATYIEQLKQTSPEAYAQLVNVSKYAADTHYGGQVQDWMAQVFTPLDVSNIPKSLNVWEKEPGYQYVANPDGGGGFEYISGVPKADLPEGVKPIKIRNPETGAYETMSYEKDMGTINGLKLAAKYNVNGELQGFSPPTGENNRLPTGQKTFLNINYDVTGKPIPNEFNNVGIGAFSGLPEFARNAAAIYLAAQGVNALTGAAGAAGASTGTATLGDLAMAYDPVAANVAAGMTPEVATTVAAEQLAASQLAQPITADAVTSAIAGNADKAALYGDAGYGPAMTGQETAAYDAGLTANQAASGVTLKGALDAARAGLLINSITGDPLGLNDTGGSAGVSGATGYDQVPIPSEWKSPTYTYSPVQNVTFEDLFPGVSLQGTQWQNMPQAQTFNEMFASGRQTPMGSPVDINQIVGSILGQSATS